MNNKYQNKKVLFIVTEDWAFWIHRLPMARAVRNLGYEVIVGARDSNYSKRIEELGFRFEPLKIQRGDGSLLREILSIVELVKLYRKERPYIIHHVAMKPIIFGSIATLFLKVPYVVNTFAGLGFLFSRRKKAQFLRPLFLLVARVLMLRKNQWISVQNVEDMKILTDARVGSVFKRQLIPGSGVNLDNFSFAPEPNGIPIAAFVGRLIWDKGVGEFVQASRLLKEEGIPLRMVLVGKPDLGNPHSVTEGQLKEWVSNNEIEWWGFREDIAPVFQKIHISVLPSYYPEGVPKTLLEAASSGRPMVSTDTPGCREIVKNNITGIIVPIQDPRALAEALKKLAKSKKTRKIFGIEARKLVKKHFSDDIVMRKTALLYKNFIN